MSTGNIDSIAAFSLECELASERETMRLAERLAGLVRSGDIVLLSGPLGAGKTAFARALIRSRLADPGLVVASPSFTLVQTYPDPEGFEIWHIDLYRLGGAAEAEMLGFEEALEEGALLLVEWAERAAELFDACERLEIRLAGTPKQQERRCARLAAFGDDWLARLENLTRDEQREVTTAPPPGRKEGQDNR